MRLAINAPYSCPRGSELEAFTRETARWLCRIDRNTLVFSPGAVSGIDESNIVLTSEARGTLLPAIGYFNSLMFNNTILPYQLAWHKADVLFCPAAEFPFVDILPMAVMIHGLEPLFNPEGYGLEGDYFKTAIGHLNRHGVRVLVGSKFLRDQLLKNSGVNPSNIDIIAQGLDTLAYRPAPSGPRKDFMARLKISSPYILCVEPGASRETVIAAFNAIKTRIAHTLLIISQDSGRSVSTDRIRYLSGVHPDDMPLIFSYADICVEAATAANILKAMASGTSVIAANTGALPEFVSDAAALFDPADAALLGKLILTALKNRTLKNEMAIKGLRYAQRFSWEKTAEDIYNSCINAYNASYNIKLNK
ncbi:MAG: glycosyltransferase [Nitrospirae bacterium]|nr:glycosyltransferase [Nitrospirota bacterium]